MTWGLGGWGMMIFWIIVVIVIIFLVRWLVGQGRGGRESLPREESAVDLLKKRYATGEIDKEEFEQKKKDLTDS
jgi:putative membrane protein